MWTSINNRVLSWRGSMIRVLVSDHRPIVRQGLKLIIANCPDMLVTGEGEDEDETANIAWKNDYDVVLLEASGPFAKNFNIVQRIKRLDRKSTRLNSSHRVAV
jgi:DNA-binding NarL/FixJ family response regulator